MRKDGACALSKQTSNIHLISLWGRDLTLKWDKIWPLPSGGHLRTRWGARCKLCEPVKLDGVSGSLSPGRNVFWALLVHRLKPYSLTFSLCLCQGGSWICCWGLERKSIANSGETGLWKTSSKFPVSTSLTLCAWFHFPLLYSPSSILRILRELGQWPLWLLPAGKGQFLDLRKEATLYFVRKFPGI